MHRLNLAMHQLEMDKVQLRSQSDAQMKDMEMHLRTQLSETNSKVRKKKDIVHFLLMIEFEKFIELLVQVAVSISSPFTLSLPSMSR